jgi:hypothetical protein
VERRAAFHLDRRTWVVGEDEDGRMERRVRSPPPLPFGIVVPAGIPELPGTHDLGTDAGLVQAHEGIVDAAAATRLARHLVPPPGPEHPFVQPFAGVAERLVEAQPLSRAEAVEGDREELDSGEGHGSSS